MVREKSTGDASLEEEIEKRKLAKIYKLEKGHGQWKK